MEINSENWMAIFFITGSECIGKYVAAGQVFFFHEIRNKQMVSLWGFKFSYGFL